MSGDPLILGALDVVSPGMESEGSQHWVCEIKEWQFAA